MSKMRKKMNEDVGGKNKSVTQILTKTTMTTSDIISRAMQWIYLDITRLRSENKGEASNLRTIKHIK